jgi:hypothetical protein
MKAERKEFKAKTNVQEKTAGEEVVRGEVLDLMRVMISQFQHDSVVSRAQQSTIPGLYAGYAGFINFNT